jgi:hydroxymethylglutaryl-CoA reductase
MNARLSGFHELPISERIETLAAECGIDAADLQQDLSVEEADDLSENVVGTVALPLGVATNFRIDGEDVLIPMAVEESSVIAAASYGAKMAREDGGFQTDTDGPYMIAQIQTLDVSDPRAARSRVLAERDRLREIANDQGVLVSHGGGCEDVTARVVDTPTGEMLVVHLIVNTADAMGANAVNTMAEGVAPEVARIAEGEVSLRILSNLADRRLTRAHCRVPPEALEHDGVDLSGEEIRDRIVDAWAFAAGDPYRAATHNKGVMNAVDALALATLNDWRAIEAGAHAYAARGGAGSSAAGGHSARAGNAAHDGYGPLTTFEVADDGALSCHIELPMQVGTVGGATSVHPTGSTAMEILDVDSADEFAGVFAALGLAENLASLRALVSEGIQTGHMKLHAENVAVQAGAPEELVEEVAAQMVAEEDVRESRAREILAELQERE